MIAAWMLYSMATAAMLGFAAAALERLCRMQRWATRWVWVGAMCAPFVSPILLMNTEALAMGAPRPVLQAAPTEASADERIASRDTAAMTLTFIARAAKSRRAASLDALLSISWAIASVALLMVVCAAWLRLQRRSQSWTRTRMAGVDVLVAEDVGPAVFGVLRPRIVAPRWLLDADFVTQRGAVAHELQHIAARDAQLVTAALFLVIATPWNLPLWICWRRLRAALEIDCDARVLRSGEAAYDYGLALLNVAERRLRAPWAAPAMNASSCALERRMALLFAERARRSAPSAAALVLTASAFTVAAAQMEPPGQLPTIAGSARAAGSRGAALGRDLVEAAQQDDFDSARTLIEAGANVDQTVLGDGSPLIIAARRGDVRLVQLLLENGAAPDLAVPGDGNPLIMAAARGHEAVVAALLGRGADLNAIVIGDETPLINAARGGHLPIVRTLVERGADVNLAVPADNSPLAEIRSPLSESRRYGHRDIVAYLQSKGAA